MARNYDAPAVTEYGTVDAVTNSKDKIGTVIDSESTSQNNLDGEIQNDS